jgi:multiple sugar transport system permease protein
MFLWTFNNFNLPFILFGGSQPPAGDLISFRIYNESFLVWNFGVSAAMAVILLVVLLAMTALYFLFVNRRSQRA